MKVFTLNKDGIYPAQPGIVRARNGRPFFSFVHGEEGRGRLEIRLPLGHRDFPVEEGPVGTLQDAPDLRERNRGNQFTANVRCDLCGDEPHDPFRAIRAGQQCLACKARSLPDPPPADAEYALIDLGRKDPRGNGVYLLGSGQADGAQLVLWSLSPGYRGGASYSISGHAAVLAEGEEAQGAAGRMGGAPCPIVLVTGPCRLEWHRSGRLYGNPEKFVAEFNGTDWSVGEPSECDVEAAVFEY